jgi:hypothetical protein
MLLLINGLKCKRIGVFSWTFSLVQKISDNNFHKILKSLKLCMDNLPKWWLPLTKTLLSLTIVLKQEKPPLSKCLRKSKNAKRLWTTISNRKRKSSPVSISYLISHCSLFSLMVRILLKFVSSLEIVLTV